MTPEELSRAVQCAVRRAVGDGALAVDVPARVVVARPGAGGRGDYATGVALQLARPAGVPARQVADVLREQLLAVPGVGGIDITGAGFLNITLAGGPPATDAALVGEVLRRGASYGRPAHLAEGSARDHRGDAVRLGVAPGIRAAVVADSAARILRSQGATVTMSDIAGGMPRATARGAVNHLIRPRPVPSTPDPRTLLGADAARWALLHPAAHHRAEIGAVHLTQRESNPFFLVRYAHSRARALVRNAADLGFASVPGDLGTPERTGRGTGTPLTAVLADYPAVLATAARQCAPDRVARYLVRAADALLRLAETYRILPFGDEKPSAVHRARLAVAEAAGTVLADGLDLLGIEAPVHV